VTGRTEESGAQRRGDSWAFRGLITLLLAGCGYVWIGLWGSQEREAEIAVPAPEPWPAAVARCPWSDHDATRSTAHAEEAEALWARFRFDVAEGPRAVERMEQAAACLRASGQRVAATTRTEQARQWRRRVREHLDREALRLELAVRHDDPDEVLRQVRRLRALTALAEGQGASESRRWWTVLERHARARRATQEEEEEEL